MFLLASYVPWFSQRTQWCGPKSRNMKKQRSSRALSNAGQSLYIYLMFSMYYCRSKKPPPLHTVADWKVVLHLPEIETWLRATSDRVTQLTHSVGQDSDSRHVDAHLVQLKVKADTSTVHVAPFLCI